MMTDLYTHLRELTDTITDGMMVNKENQKESVLLATLIITGNFHQAIKVMRKSRLTREKLNRKFWASVTATAVHFRRSPKYLYCQLGAYQANKIKNTKPNQRKRGIG